MPIMLITSIFFFNDTATTEIYTLSLHDALPISCRWCCAAAVRAPASARAACTQGAAWRALGAGPAASPPRRIDRKSTRLNSSHLVISYAVFCLKKKKKFITVARSNQHVDAHADH